MLDAIQAKLGALAPSDWAAKTQAWGELVALYRQYAEGDHRAKMTPEMKAMLRISDARTDQFNINYCDMVVQTMADRLKVTAVDGDNDAASAWSADLLTFNRMDGLQMKVHEAAIRDGVTYVMVAYDNDAQKPRLEHEEAYDGECGLIAVYDRTRKNIVAAVKIWLEGDSKFVNIYFPNRVEKYAYGEGGDLKDVIGQPVAWVDQVTNEAVGVPVVAFQSREKSRSTTGSSEIAPVIPIQDGLNRTLVSMVITAELTAFQIRYAVGWSPPAGITPGMWLKISETQPLTPDERIEVGTLQQGQLDQYLAQALFLIDQIGTVSRTPLPQHMGGDNASGEALKQREVGLLGKVERFQVTGGNAWENTLMMAAAVQQAFGLSKPPVAARFNTKWKTAAIRNDTDVIKNVKEAAQWIGDEEALRQIAPVFGFDEDKIQRLLQQLKAQKAADLSAMGGNVPGFNQFALPANGNGADGVTGANGVNPQPMMASVPAR